MNIYEKIQAVTDKIKNIEKNMQIGSGNYAYKATKDADVINAINPAEKEFKLVSIPIKQELVNSEVIKTHKENKEVLTFVDTIKMTLRIIDLEKPESFIDVESYGKGIDSGDKGFGKASTYARKIALLNAYKLSTGEDPDGEKSKEIDAVKEVSENKKAVMNYLNVNPDSATKLCEHYGISSPTSLTDEQIGVIYVTYKKKGLL